MLPEEHIVDQIPAYALGILDEDETWEVTRHLAGCEVCQEELQDYQRVVDLLPLAVGEQTPTPELKRAVLGKIAAYEGRRAAPARPSLRDRLASFLPAPGAAWAWSSLALILVLAVSNLFLWQRFQQLQARDVDRLQVVVLMGSDITPQATGSMVIGRDGQVGTLVVDGLPPLDEQHQYQLWLIQDGERLSGGVFSVSVDGYGSLYIHAPRPVRTFTGLGVTIEPAGGSPAPTGENVLKADL